jgi:hypothetical protein
MKETFLMVVFLLMTGVANSQTDPLFKGFERLFTQPKHYVIAYTSTPPVIDGDIDDKIWAEAAWTEAFSDIEGELSNRPLPYHKTYAKMLWDNDYLYIAAKMEEKHVWANLTERDQIVFHDNDFEVFLEPGNSGHRYFEYEINALNTMFDLYLPQPYRANANYFIPWDSKALKHAVKVTGTLNDPSDEDEGWTVELAIPFKDISSAPQDGNIWRLGFSRVEWDIEIADNKYVKKTDVNGKTLPENNWVWSPQGAINMHMPERWGYIQFSTIEAGAELPEFVLPYSELQRQYLWLIYYKQQAFRKTNKRFAKTLKELGMNKKVQIEGKFNTLELEATSSLFAATISDTSQSILCINNDGLVKKLK